jgi:hypothetical protein
MKSLIMALFVGLVSLPVLADNSTGCGLGSLIWKDNSIVSALFRMTTNQSFSSQLFGITSGTSGCSQHSIVKRDMAPVYYAEANIEELKVEMAQGKGEYVSIFADALGCPETLKPEFSKMTKEKYETIFPKSDVSPIQMLDNVKKMMKEAPALSGRCTYASL